MIMSIRNVAERAHACKRILRAVSSSRFFESGGPGRTPLPAFDARFRDVIPVPARPTRNGVGMLAPIATDATGYGRARSRRVELVPQ